LFHSARCKRQIGARADPCDDIARRDAGRGVFKAVGFESEPSRHEHSCADNADRRLARFFDNSPEFWLNLQQMHDLTKAKLALAKTIEAEVRVYRSAAA